MHGGVCAAEPGFSISAGDYYFLVEDSDDNGILDGVEAAMDENGVVSDIDGDTVPDFVSEDNDGDGIGDVYEIEGMSVGATTYINADCDGDGEFDPRGTLENPRDCDGDGIPDYNDLDSDGDTIPDSVESTNRASKYYATYSLDSDGDGISDHDECRGEVDPTTGLFTSCADTDGDGIPDYLDLDSDGDGLPDAFEVAWGSSPTNPDTDGDGDTDLIEYGAGTNPNDKNDNAENNGNFVFVAPYEEATTPERKSLSFQTAIQSIDLFFVFDRTGSMDSETANLAQKLPGILNELQCKDLGRSCEDNDDCAGLSNAICSENRRCITDPSYGEGCFDSMYTGLAYYHNMHAFWISSLISENVNNTVNALRSAFRNVKADGSTDSKMTSSNFCSAGSAEVPYQAPICALLGNNKYNGFQYCNVTGTVSCANSPTGSNTCPTMRECKIGCSTDSSRVGCAGFRSGAVRVIIEAFDEEQCYSNTSYTNWRAYCKNFQYDVGKILQAYNTRYIGLWSGRSSTYKDYATTSSKVTVSMEEVAKKIGTDSNSLSDAGTPFTYQAADEAVGEKTKEAVKEISRNMPMNITVEVQDIDGDGASAFVDHLELNLSGEKVKNRICTKIDTGKINTTDAKFPGITGLLPGTSVCYDVIPVQNQKIKAPSNEPKVYRARVVVKGDGSVLNSGIAYFLVPPLVEQDIDIK